jgi:flagellar basal-body rod modification protein FlgD
MSPVTSSTNTADPPATSTAPTDPLASESTFLTLLVSQLQNQDPLNPVDSTQFVAQLTSYSQLEQLINIDHNTTPAAPAAPASSASTSASTSKTEI